jgi:hypothetical protein
MPVLHSKAFPGAWEAFAAAGGGARRYYCPTTGETRSELSEGMGAPAELGAGSARASNAIASGRRRESGDVSVYSCPCYRTTDRGKGTTPHSLPAHVLTAQLESRTPSSRWVLAGAALVLDTT